MEKEDGSIEWASLFEWQLIYSRLMNAGVKRFRLGKFKRPYTTALQRLFGDSVGITNLFSCGWSVPLFPNGFAEFGQVSLIKD